MKFLVIFFSAILLFANVGNITDMKGDVKIVRNQKSIKANINIPLDINDTVVTYDNSKAKIVFKDNTIITIGKNSAFKIKEYFMGKKPKAKFNFLKGTFLSMTGKIGKIAPKRFKLETKNASIGIRGTIVFGEIYPTKDIIGCSKGLISVTKNGQTILVKEGKMIMAFENIITTPMKIPAKYLTHIISNLSLKKSDVKTFFNKVYKPKSNKNIKSNLKNKLKTNSKIKLTWDDYKQVQNQTQNKNIESIINIKNENFKFKDYGNKLFLENLKNNDSGKNEEAKEEPQEEPNGDYYESEESEEPQ
jgi:hypothetical protein